jgi:hypothetical protein
MEIEPGGPYSVPERSVGPTGAVAPLSGKPGWGAKSERSQRPQTQSASRLISVAATPNTMRPVTSSLAPEENSGPIDNPPLNWRSPGPKLDADDVKELDCLLARLAARLAAGGDARRRAIA